MDNRRNQRNGEVVRVHGGNPPDLQEDTDGHGSGDVTPQSCPHHKSAALREKERIRNLQIGFGQLGGDTLNPSGPHMWDMLLQGDTSPVSPWARSAALREAPSHSPHALT